MNNCGTCKFWGSDDDNGWQYSLLFHSTRVGMDELEEEALLQRLENSFQTCQGVLEIPSAEDILETDALAYTIDGSRYKARLRTRENFGCANWVKKED